MESRRCMAPQSDRIQVRWRNGWTAIPHTILRDSRLSRSARLLWGILASYAGNEEAAWPQQKDLAQACAEDDKVPHIRTIQRWLKELETYGWLASIQTRHGNIYELFESQQRDTSVEETTPVSCQTRHQDRVRGDTSVVSEATPVSHGLINKNQLIRNNNNTPAAQPKKPTDTETYRLLRDRQVWTAKKHAHEPLEIIQAYLDHVGPNYPAAQIALDLKAGVHHRLTPEPEPSPPHTEPANDDRRPAWIGLDQWQGLTSNQRDALQYAQLVNGRIQAQYDDWTEMIYKRWGPLANRLVEAAGGTQ